MRVLSVKQDRRQELCSKDHTFRVNYVGFCFPAISGLVGFLVGFLFLAELSFKFENNAPAGFRKGADLGHLLGRNVVASKSHFRPRPVMDAGGFMRNRESASPRFWMKASELYSSALVRKLSGEAVGSISSSWNSLATSSTIFG
jgi:hypothetical protein